MNEGTVHDVSDTALWVATYRARESARQDALFSDPFAARLAGERGARIAQAMSGGEMVEWNVALRTVIIDEYVRRAVAEGVDTVLNLGAGLDARPYRMGLALSLNWIEADFANIIEHKVRILKDERPNCRLSAVALDLGNKDERRQFLKDIASQSKSVLVITEGVIPYLSAEQVGELAHDLRELLPVRYWIVDYMSADLVAQIKKRCIGKSLANAPFRFAPVDWEGFFLGFGWRINTMRYLADEGEKQRRPPPYPLIVKLLLWLSPKGARDKVHRYMGYVLMEPIHFPSNTK